ncbi:MAG TPA: VOC family protein [Dongiaceae bacterium]|nr:VOC family protein [Dongiaceae bacterium]
MNLNQVTAPAHDLAASIAFYEMLGLKLIVRADHYARFECPDGDATFSLALRDTPSLPDREGIHVYFECDDLDERVAALKKHGVGFESDPVDQRWLWREAWLTDPAGNLICLYRAGQNRKQPPWRIG